MTKITIKATRGCKRSYVPVLKKFLNGRYFDMAVEWGPGRSTVLIQGHCRVLKTHEDKPSWKSLYNDNKYIEPHVEINLITDVDEYVALPSVEDESVEFVFIDGIERTRCVDTAHRILKPGGYIVVHDCIELDHRFRIIDSDALTVVGVKE